MSPGLREGAARARPSASLRVPPRGGHPPSGLGLSPPRSPGAAALCPTVPHSCARRAHPDSRVPPPARFPGSAPACFMRYSGFGAWPGPGSARLAWPQAPERAYPVTRSGTYTARGPGKPAPRPRHRGSWRPRAAHTASAACTGLITGGELLPRACRPPSKGGCGGAEHAQWRRRGWAALTYRRAEDCRYRSLPCHSTAECLLFLPLALAGLSGTPRAATSLTCQTD